MGDWLDLLAVCVNEWMRKNWLENGLGYIVYLHYSTILCDGENIRKRWKECRSKRYAKGNNAKTAFHASQQISIEPEPLLSKVRKTIQSLKLGRSSGIDDITAELKHAGENAEIFYRKLIVKLWCEKIWIEDRLKSVFIPIPKSGDTH